MNDIGRNIKYYRELNRMTQSELAKRLGVTDKAVSTWEIGTREPRMGLIEAMSNLFGVSKSTLLGWTDAGTPDLDYTTIPNIEPMPNMKKIPLLGTIACGVPITAVENYEGDVDVPEHVHADFALRCRGDSMINARIFDGDIVYIRDQQDVDSGQIAAVLIDGEATLKRVRKLPDRLILEAENPAYNSITIYYDQITDENAVRIIGLAVAFTSAVR